MNKLLTVIVKTLILLSLMPLSVQAQSGFIYRYSTPEDEWPSDIVQTSDGGYIISAAIGTFFNQYQTLLIRLSSSGDTIMTQKLSEPNGYCVMTDLVKMEDGSYMGIGQMQTFANGYKLWLVRFNESLTILLNKSFSFNDSLVLSYFNAGFVDHFHNLIVYGAAAPADTIGKNHTYIFKFTQTGDSIDFHYYRSHYGQVPSSMVEKSDSSGYYLANTGLYEFQPSTASQVLTINYSLEVTDIDSIPHTYAFYLNIKCLELNKILLTGKKALENTNPRTDKLGIQKLDTTFHCMGEYLLGPDDTVSYPAYYTNMDFKYVTRLYYGGIANQSIGAFPNFPSYILLAQFDTSLNLAFKKYYGGDVNYMLWSVIATTDGGCILGASSYDWTIQNQERDIYILKVDSNGLITGMEENSQLQLPKVIITPNPGCDKLNCESHCRVSSLALTDMIGKEVYRQKMDQGRNCYDIQNLKPGFYIYTVYDGQGIVQTGKWIKK